MIVPDYYYDFRRIADTVLTVKYDIPTGDLPWVKEFKKSNQPISFHNGCKMWLDESSLPPSCSDVTNLSNKGVLYGLFCNWKFYVGSTEDFGERMSTHVMDSKKDGLGQELYSDMIKTGECVVFVFAIVDHSILLKAESDLIRECKEYSIKKSCNFDETAIKFITESISDSREYASNYCYNIKD